MAQLTDDCFAFSGPLMPLADMEKLIVERVQPVSETEVVSLNEARGRVIAEDTASPLNLPPFDNSAVDGYAVRHRDLAASGETKLAVTGRLTAGKAAPVKMRTAWFGSIGPDAALPAVRRPATASFVSPPAARSRWRTA